MAEQNSHNPLMTEPLEDMEVSLEDAVPGETTVQHSEVQAISWADLPDAKSLRSHIFSTPDINEEIVQIPEWRCKILIRGLNAKTRSKILQGAMNKDGTPNLEKMYPDLIIATARHVLSGEPIFQPADRDALNEKSGGVLERLAMKAAQLSGLDKDSQDRAVQNFQ